MRPAYDVAMAPAARVDGPLAWIDVAGGIEQIGNDGSVFGWDNEFPRHTALIHPFRIADRLVTSGEWLAFIQDGGYRTPSLWLADGWAAVQREGWRAPLYWFEQDGAWQSFSLRGVHAVDHDVPVTHVSYFEADAFARWAGHRLPTEFEWEVASRRAPLLRQMFGVAWQWTQSAYAPYPGYRPAAGVAPQLVV